MRYTTQVIVFGMAYYCGSMIPSRVLSKFSKGSDSSTQFRGIGSAGVNFDSYVGRADTVQRFRLFEGNVPQAQEDITANYLAQYSSDPLSKPELLDQLMKNISKKVDLSSIF
jgi:hypothetical protein